MFIVEKSVTSQSIMSHVGAIEVEEIEFESNVWRSFNTKWQIAVSSKQGHRVAKCCGCCLLSEEFGFLLAHLAVP